MLFRTKIILGLALIETLFLAIITVVTSQQLTQDARLRLEGRTRTDVALLASAAETGILTNDLGGLRSLVRGLATNHEIGLARVLDRDGRVLAEAGARQALATTFHDGYLRPPGMAALFAATQVVSVAHVRYGSVQLALSAGPFMERLAIVHARMVAVAIGETVLAIFFAFYFGSYLGRKLRVLEDAATLLGEGRLGYQAPVTGHDEISRALVAFNHMSKRLQEEMDQRLHQDAVLKELTVNLETRVAQRTQELAEANTALQYLALHDTVTGLPNRLLFVRELDRLLLARPGAPETFAVMILDLDGFKGINDHFGHDAGDQVLRAVGSILRGVIRASDIVARFGGDEFALLLPCLRGGRETLVAIADKVQRAFLQPLVVGVDTCVVGASMGAALCPDDGLDAALLIHRADMAMYWAKRHKARFCVYEIELEEQQGGVHDASVHERRFVLALARQEFVLHYQPILSLADDVVESVEALVRWQHPERGLLPPAEFIPKIEQAALMGPFTLYVLDHVLADYAAGGFGPAPLVIAINISALNLIEDDFPDHVAKRLAGTPGVRLTLELTESALIGDAGRAAQIITRLRALGVSIAVDDYGTGYASIAYLRTLPLDVVKIDRSLVAAMEGNENEREIVRTIIELCHRLGYRVIAEGVEEGAQILVLRDLHCDCVQGYAIARPMPLAALKVWLQEHSEQAYDP